MTDVLHSHQPYPWHSVPRAYPYLPSSPYPTFSPRPVDFPPSSPYSFPPFAQPMYPPPPPPSPYPSHSAYPPPSPRSSIDSNAVVVLEGLLGKEQTLCIQLRSLTVTIAKLTKDVLATGSACPSSFVKILKDQVAKLQDLMTMLKNIEAQKKAFPNNFVVQVAQQWTLKCTKQKALSPRKRKSMEEPTCPSKEVKTNIAEQQGNNKKQDKVFIPTMETFKTQRIKIEEDVSPRELMSINNLIN